VFEALMAARGIGIATTVVLYGDENNWLRPTRTGT